MKIERNISLKPFNTFGVECNAEKFIHINSIDDLTYLFEDKSLSVPDQLVLGGGSNILFTKKSIGQVVLIDIGGLEIIDGDDQYGFLKGGAGEIWDNLVKFSLKNNLFGIENLSIIPGKAGAAPIQNIGAYGVELSDFFESLKAFDLSTGKVVNFTRNDCEFGYRNSIFKSSANGKFVICEITLKLKKHADPNISYGALQEVFNDREQASISASEVREEVIKIRNSKLPNPAEIGNGGSFFKNPVIEQSVYSEIRSKLSDLPGYTIDENHIKVPAGWLIEKCGWKGKQIGDAGVHKNQALVLVNLGNAAGKEIHDLALQIQSSVLQEFGIILEPEVNII